MKMNLNLILPMLKSLLPKEKAQLLDDSIAALQQYKANHQVNSLEDAMKALHDLRVPKGFLPQTGGLAKNPVVSSIAQMCNVDMNKIQQDIQQLSNGQTVQTGTLESYKNDLKNL